MWEIQNRRIIGALVLTLGTLIMACKSKKEPLPVDIPEIHRLDTTEFVTAGDSVRLAFMTKQGVDAVLQLENSYGTTLAYPKTNDRGIEFLFPDPVTQVAGLCNWQLIVEHQIAMHGDLLILPAADSGIQMESYLGPKDIIAGSSEKAMVVSIPADRFDNPLPDGTPIKIEERFQDEITIVEDSSQHLIHWKEVVPHTSSGRIFVKSMVGNSASVEMYTDVSPGKATDFDLRYQRNHDFADGNQVIEFETSELKDLYGNTVADGTLVTFQIETDQRNSLFTNATTVNGVAVAKMVHPDAATRWKITAFVAGVANSSSLTLDFRSAIQEFTLTFKEDKQIISTSPVKGFMGQLVPDFTPVEIILKFADERKEMITVYTRDGHARFDLKSLLSEVQPEEIEVQILGLSKSINP